MNFAHLLLLGFFVAAPASGITKCSGATTAADVMQELKADLSGRTVLMTGGDSGIGLAAATALASANATVIIASLLPDTSGAAAKQQIVNATGNEKISVVPLDLSSLTSVKQAADTVQRATATLDVLVADAGIDHCPASLAPLTDDGYERVFQVNYLGHFLLAQLLTPLLSAASPPGRVVNVASGAHASACQWASADADCLDLAELPPPVRQAGNNSAGAPISNYGITKFLQIYHARELAARAPGGVRAYSLEPGFVDTPMTRQLNPATRKRWCMFQTHCPHTANEGAATVAYVAAAPDTVLSNGAYYSQCSVSTPKAWDSASQQALFESSENWVGNNAAVFRQQ